MVKLIKKKDEPSSVFEGKGDGQFQKKKKIAACTGKTAIRVSPTVPNEFASNGVKRLVKLKALMPRYLMSMISLQG